VPRERARRRQELRDLGRARVGCGFAIIARAMRSGRYLRAWSPMMLLVGVWLGAAVPARAAPDHASVLILLPGQPGLPAAGAIASGVRAALLTEWSFRVSHRNGACRRSSLRVAGGRRASAPTSYRLEDTESSAST
jgi:hypothetical protein